MPYGLLGSPSSVESIDPYGYDADARRYIRAVETSDKQPLEVAVRVAINEFVVGCKNDGTWNAIKACCLLMGARTLSGALTPLVGPAPTNVNFVSGDYDRKTGLKGNGSTKYLNTGTFSGSQQVNNNHSAVYVTQTNAAVNAFQCLIGCYQESPLRVLQIFANFGSGSMFLDNGAALTGLGVASQNGFVGNARANSQEFVARIAGASAVRADTSGGVASAFPIIVFARGKGSSSIDTYSEARMTFYSTGDALNLAFLDSRAATLTKTIQAALP